MLKKTRRTKPRKNTIIYYGTGKVKLYWSVRVHDAKKDVTIDGTLMDAINGTPGETIGCHLSNCAISNKSKFPHECILPAFTKGTCHIIDKVTNGKPSHAVRYIHSYGKLVDLNDTDKTRDTILRNPRLAQTTFTLRAPRGGRKKGAGHASTRPTGKRTGESTATVPRGALARARKANLVTADLERVLKSV